MPASASAAAAPATRSGASLITILSSLPRTGYVYVRSPAANGLPASVGAVIRPATSTSPALLAATDALAILDFVTVGLLSHDDALTASGYARDALPLLAGWFGAAAFFHPYRALTTRRLLATWVVGIPVGIVIRGIALGRSPDGDQLAFLIVALVFSLL